ncbi:MAG: MerC domain-containing protein [Bacteroidetes bacterium]|nr:MAG: MerC domain-containing protein [Bacteroidota bacterium]
MPFLCRQLFVHNLSLPTDFRHRMSRFSLPARFSDYLGITSALICLLHCLAGPFVLGATMHLHEHQAHGESGLWWLDHRWDYFFLLLGLIAVWFSARHTHRRTMKVLLWMTYGALAGAILLETQAMFFQFLVYGASLGLIAAHVYNLRHLLRRQQQCVSPGCCS